jgi:iron complex outermembrane recepter protein
MRFKGCGQACRQNAGGLADMSVMTTVRLLTVTILGLGCACAQHVGDPTNDLDKVSLDELFTVQVTSVGRKAQQLSKASAAVFVLTADDIRRSGATSIPEALQWVPGLTVLRAAGGSWIVSARGGARIFSDKILVMIDGRSLYTPLFNGVIWDSIDVPLQDIRQIEVVRGPGAVMWGPNAVNGVINIITENAHATTGAAVSVSAGNELRAAAEARWGAAPSERFAYRVWGQSAYSTPGFDSPGYHRFDNSYTHPVPSAGNLDSATGRVGFRFDGQPTEKDQWMVQGDLYKLGRQDPVAYAVLLPEIVDQAPGHTGYEGGFIQGRWTRTSSTGSESELRFSYDNSKLNYPFTRADCNNLTVDYQKRWQTGERNEVYLGAGYQQYWDETTGHRFIGFDPRTSVYRVGDAVVRDEFQIIPNRLIGSVGARIDYGSYRQVEYQPSFRLLYTPSAKQSAWLAASRAVRAPSRYDRDIVVDSGSILMQGLPVALSVFGSRSMRSEVERSLEAGYRLQSGQRWSVDTSVFWSHYDRLRSFQQPVLPVVSFVDQLPQFQLPATVVNAGAGRSYGAEIYGTWRVRNNWRLIPSYSYLNESRWLPASPTLAYVWDLDPSTLPHQTSLRSEHNLTRSLQLDVMARFRSRDANYNLPGAFLVNSRLGWRPTRSGELSVSVQNLTDRRVLECYAEGSELAIPIRRTFVIRWTQRL